MGMLSYKQEMIWGALVLLAIGGMLIFYLSKYQRLVNPSPSERNLIAEQPFGSQAQRYTLAQVQAHAIESDCWLIIDEKVYDVTGFIMDHPGGANRIIPYCGQDASTAFATQGGIGFHSAVAKQLLQKLEIGELISP
jgi:cytochrome b involved in lipid metabolism